LKGCLETTVRYDIICKKDLTSMTVSKILYTFTGGPLDFQPAKPRGKSDTALNCEFEPRSWRYLIPHCVIKIVTDLRQVGGFLRLLRFPPPIKLTATI